MQERGKERFYGDAEAPEEMGRVSAQERLENATRNIEKIDAERARLLEERRMRERDIEEASAELGDLVGRTRGLAKSPTDEPARRP